MYEIPSHSSKFGVRYSLSRKQIARPSFFEETINAGIYPHLLTKFIALLKDNERNCLFQQDGEIDHTAKRTAFLQDFSVIALSGLALATTITRPFAT
jgi:hypothetical protein